MSAAEARERMVKATLTLGNEPDGLDKLAFFVQEFFARANLSGELPFAFDLALTEWITNVRNYGFGKEGSGSIRLKMLADGSAVEAAIEDDAPAFNPVEHPEVDINTPMEQKPIGGLGIHLIRKFMDQVEYERRGNKNRLVMRKNIPPAP